MEMLTPNHWNSWDRFYKANFINSLTGFKSATLIGSVNEQGVTNLSIFSSIVHLGSNPALIGYINRPEAASPHTLSNIRSTGFYTMNHITESFVDKAHQSSAKYPEGVSEFEEVGLTPHFEKGFIAPFVKESQLKFMLSLQDIIPIQLNNTFLVIGKLEFVLAEDAAISSDGLLQLDKMNSISGNGSNAYYATNLIDRFEYAKPDLPIRKLI